jgi:broad specificity phosphatase PhoE
MQGGGFDIELNENGRQQAIRVAQELEGLAAGIVASSHLQRAKQTADILHQNNCPSAKRIILKEFGEMRFGELEGLALRGPEATSATREKFRSWNEKMRLDSQLEWPGGGESTAHVAKRGRSGIDMLLDQYPEEQHIVVVAHGRFNKILLATLLYGDECRHDLVKQGNACVNIIDLNIEGRHTWTARVINHVEHINGDLTPSPNALS